jgi:hypothetical protein
VLGPSNPDNVTGDWEMAVSAKRELEEGEEALLSYYEGSNDEFLLAYGGSLGGLGGRFVK